jgi:hypothetical protein
VEKNTMKESKFFLISVTLAHGRKWAVSNFRIKAETIAQHNYERQSFSVKSSKCKDRHPGHEAPDLDRDFCSLEVSLTVLIETWFQKYVFEIYDRKEMKNEGEWMSCLSWIDADITRNNYECIYFVNKAHVKQRNYNEVNRTKSVKPWPRS